VRDGATFTTIEIPGSYDTRARGINNIGQVVGVFSDGTATHSFVKDGALVTTIEVPGAIILEPRGINDTGQIVGWFYDGTSVHGFVKDGTTFTTIDVPGAYDTYAYGINNTGQIVGTFNDITGWHGFVTAAADTTRPVIASTVTPTPNAAGWNNSTPVTVTWSVTDPESGIVSSSGCSTTTLTSPTTGTILTCSATNGAGLSDAQSVTVKIDTTRPTLSGLPAHGCTLWPPNHKLVQVGIVSATDTLSGLVSFAVTATSNEPAAPKEPDIVITGSGVQPRGVQLRADRLGTGPGRLYTVTASARDLAGNTISATATCLVPHDQGH
jgi:probable HAF family extracellular repeat protein